MLADDPDDTAALDPHPHIDHQADFLPGCNQAAAQEVVVGEVEEEEEEVEMREDHGRREGETPSTIRALAGLITRQR